MVLFTKTEGSALNVKEYQYLIYANHAGIASCNNVLSPGSSVRWREVCLTLQSELIWSDSEFVLEIT